MALGNGGWLVGTDSLGVYPMSHSAVGRGTDYICKGLTGWGEKQAE